MEGGVAVARGPGSGALVIRRAGVGGFAQNPSAVPVPRRRISASASQLHPRIMETARHARMWPRILFSHVEVTTNTVRETKAPGSIRHGGQPGPNNLKPSIMEFEADAVRECNWDQSGSPDFQRRTRERSLTLPRVAWLFAPKMASA